MVVQKPPKVKINRICKMQIVKSITKCVNKYNQIYRFKFVIRIWPDENNINLFFDFNEWFGSLGKSAENLKHFVEIISQEEYDSNETDFSYLIGSVFEGKIKSEIYYDTYGPNIIYYLEIIKSYGIFEIKGDINNETI